MVRPINDVDVRRGNYVSCKLPLSKRREKELIRTFFQI